MKKDCHDYIIELEQLRADLLLPLRPLYVVGDSPSQLLGPFYRGGSM